MKSTAHNKKEPNIGSFLLCAQCFTAPAAG